MCIFHCTVIHALDLSQQIYSTQFLVYMKIYPIKEYNKELNDEAHVLLWLSFFFTVVQHELTIKSDYKITNQISFSSYIILYRDPSLKTNTISK